MVERLEQEEEKKAAVNAEEIKIDEPVAQNERSEQRWKNKFIKIWQLDEQLQRQNEENEKFVGPKHFKALMKLG